MHAAVASAGALMQYLDETQRNALSHIRTIHVVSRSEYMVLDASTRRNLELTQPLRYGGSKKNTLLYLIDKTKSGMGSRMARDWLERPLQSIPAIESRLDAVTELFDDFLLRKQLQEQLRGMYDVERLTSKIVYGTVQARDCIALIETLSRIPPIRQTLCGAQAASLQRICDALDPMPDTLALLSDAITEEPPASMKDGGYIRAGYNEEVDRLRSIADGTQAWLASFEREERERFCIGV